MRERLKALLGDARLREIARYCVVGALTTLVNLGAYWLIRLPFGDAPSDGAVAFAVGAAWVIAVAFAYAANKLFVFRSRTDGARTLREAGSFLAARLASLGFEYALMFALMKLAGMGDMWAKVICNVLVIIINYALSKLWIFKKGDKE